MNYWLEALDNSLDEHCPSVDLTPALREAIANDLRIAHEMYAEVTGQICIPNPLKSDLEATKRALKAEREKVHCRECNGHGTITTPGPYHSSTSQCWKCHGEGKHAP